MGLQLLDLLSHVHDEHGMFAFDAILQRPESRVKDFCLLLQTSLNDLHFILYQDKDVLISEPLLLQQGGFLMAFGLLQLCGGFEGPSGVLQGLV